MTRAEHSNRRNVTHCYLNNAAAICSLGNTIEHIEQQLFSLQASPLQVSDAYSPGQAVPLGRVTTDFGKTDKSIENSRNNRLLQTCLQPLLKDIEALKIRHGSHRIGVIIGSSTSGISEGEHAEAEHKKNGNYPDSFDYVQLELGAPARFTADYLDINGPAWTISTACTSGAKALASAQRLLRTGLVDAVIAGGCDTLCALTVQGFSALGAISDQLCQPFSQNRSGINIGEAAALFIVSHEPATVALSGIGECSDAHHISAPEPQGVGAEKAMQQALTTANISAADIDYVNLHGTATEQNDAMESRAIARVFKGNSTIACSSTKPLTGHTLGAAGALEAIFCYLALKRNDGRLPPHLWDRQADPALPALPGLNCTSLAQPLQHVMSNSFAFGGNNVSLILSRSENS